MSKHYLLGKQGMEAYGEVICELAPPSGWSGSENAWVRSALLIRIDKPGSVLLTGRQILDSDCFAFSSDQSQVAIKNHLRSLHELLDCRGAAGFWPWYRGDCLLALLQAVREGQQTRIMGPMSGLWLPQTGFHKALGQSKGAADASDSQKPGGLPGVESALEQSGVLSLTQPEHWALQQWMRLRIESETEAVRRQMQIEEGLELPSLHLSRTLGRVSRASKRPSAFELAAASLLSEELEFESRIDPLGFTLQICEAWLEAGYPPAAASLLYERLGAFRFWDSPILQAAPVPFPLNYVDLLRRKLTYLGEAQVYSRRSNKAKADPAVKESGQLLRELAAQDATVFMPIEETSSESMHLKWFEEQGERGATLALGDKGDFVEYGDLQALQIAIVDKAKDFAGMRGWNYFDRPSAGTASVYWIPRADRSCWLHVQEIAWVDVRLRRQQFEFRSGEDGASRLRMQSWLGGANAELDKGADLDKGAPNAKPSSSAGSELAEFMKPVPLQSMDLAVLDWDFSSDRESVQLGGEFAWGWRASQGRADWHQCLRGCVEAAIDHRLFRLNARISFEGITLSLTLRVPDSSSMRRDFALDYAQGEMNASGGLIAEELIWPLQAEMTPVDAADGSRLQLSDRVAGALTAQFSLEAAADGSISPQVVWKLPVIEPCIEIRRPHGGLELARLKLTEPQQLAVWGRS